MKTNPYKYKGPLEPVKDRLVCVPRKEEISRLKEGIKKGDYWSILGPRQIGKTTLLRQLQHTYPHAHYIYFNFEVFHADEEVFYQSLMDRFFIEISTAKKKPPLKKWPDNPELQFFDFLMKLQPKDDTKKIILMFDEIDSLPFLDTFLHLWRVIFHERYHKKELNKYAVIVTGTVDLIAQTIGKTSPFNIAEILTLKDFPETESRQLIENPFKNLEIPIEEKAIDSLVSQISGHPQQLQQACSLLVETAGHNPGKPLTMQDVDKALQVLLTTNDSLETLKQDLGRENLKKLIEEILNGEKRKYYPYKEFSLVGSGSIVDKDSYCAIRNKLYEQFLNDMIPILPNIKEPPDIGKTILNQMEKSGKNIIDAVLAHPGKAKIEMDDHMTAVAEQRFIRENKEQEILTVLEDVLIPPDLEELSPDKSYFFDIYRLENPGHQTGNRWVVENFKFKDKPALVDFIFAAFLKKIDRLEIDPLHIKTEIVQSLTGVSVEINYKKTSDTHVGGFVKKIVYREEKSRGKKKGLNDSQVIKIPGKYKEMNKEEMYQKIIRLMDEDNEFRDIIFFYYQMVKKSKK